MEGKMRWEVGRENEVGGWKGKRGGRVGGKTRWEGGRENEVGGWEGK